MNGQGMELEALKTAKLSRNMLQQWGSKETGVRARPEALRKHIQAGNQ